MRGLGQYYMSRVIKLGLLNQEKLLDAVLSAPVIERGKFDWTVTDVVDARTAEIPFVFGNLVKYSREGKVIVIDEPAKQQLGADAPNLLEASAPFVYLPDYSGLAYLHVWNGIQYDVFPRRFEAIIERAYNEFFVGCEVEPIADYRAFVERLRSLEKITELSATVHPPNPLFGRLWGSLDEYIKQRRAAEVNVREKSDAAEGLATKLLKLMTDLLANPKSVPNQTPSITDAAMLMAADGYGKGKAVGTERGNKVVIRTSESHKSFSFDQNPSPEALAAIASRHFSKVSIERDMEH